MTQPAVTVALRNLERDVGVTLLTRHATGVDLTLAGSAFLAQARLALEHIAEATSNARQA
jgi:LysR family hca operon transcriptional activator